MRYLAIVGVGFGISTLGACGGTDDALGTRGNPSAGTGGFLGTVTCAADADCRGGEICQVGVCVSARSGSGGSLPVSTGGASTNSGGRIGAGGIPVGFGGAATGGIGAGGIGAGGSAAATGGGAPDSGAGGAAGADAGGGAGRDASAGAGGTPLDGGAGAATTGGTTASGGTQATGGATATGGMTTDGGGTGGSTTTRIRCGATTTCDPGEICCFSGRAASPTFRCAGPNPDGGAPCAGGQQTVRCASNADCPGSQVCCRTTSAQGTNYSCADQCAQGSLEITCSAATCPSNQVCCESVNGTQTVATGFACKSSCTPTEFLVCDGNTQCDPGSSCLISNILPALIDVCR